MKAIDTNLLVYAHRRDMPWHPAAKALMDERASARDAWAIPWPCVHEFLAVVSNPRIFRKPTPVGKAVRQLRAWLSSPSLVVLAEGEGYLDILADLLEASQVVGARVHDARIAALCLSYGVTELWTADRDFSRFTSLTTRNPLVTTN